jgi:hypothetical protein
MAKQSGRTDVIAVTGSVAGLVSHAMCRPVSRRRAASLLTVSICFCRSRRLAGRKTLD